MILYLSEVSLSRVHNAFTERCNFSFEATKKKVNELCFAVVVFCFLFPQKVLKSGFESPVDLLVGTPGTLLEFLERGKG